MKPLNFSLPAVFAGALLVGVTAGLTTSMNAAANHNTPQALEKRVAPVGKLNVVEAGAATARAGSSAVAPQNGETVHNTVCAVCHGTGIAGAPKTGDAAAWTERLGQGMATLVEHAITGFQGAGGVMPPKGGNPSLSDAEVEAAVKYMVEQSQ